MSRRFLNQVVVVTGASAGLGKAIALAFAKEGASVGLIARNKDRLFKVKNEIEACGVRAVECICDVSNARQLEQAAQRIENSLGPPDIWVNNAIVTVLSPVKEMLPHEYERVTAVNYLGTVYGTLAALKRMMKKDKGTIIQIGSVLAYRSIPLQSAYCAAKHAILGFQNSLQCELLHDESRIKLCMVQMPALNTPQFDWLKSRMTHRAMPLAPIFQPEVGAQAVLWMAENPRRELNVTFLTSLYAWGNKFFPGFGDWYLSKKGYRSQQSEGIEDPRRKENLYQTIDGDLGSHGRFDRQSRDKSFFLWFQTRCPSWLSVVVSTAIIVFCFHRF